MFEKVGQQCQEQAVGNADRADDDNGPGKISEFHREAETRESDQDRNKHQADGDGPSHAVLVKAFLACERNSPSRAWKSFPEAWVKRIPAMHAVHLITALSL